MKYFDITFSILIIIITLPLFLIVSILIKIDSKGPIFFLQKRVGYNGELFNLIKFRGMYVDAKTRFPEYYERENKISLDDKFHVKNDKRITSVGKFIRKTSIDELPNFINVLLGNMRIVGPRPEIPDVFENYGEFKEIYITFVPGITSYSKVYGRDELEKGKTLELDFKYLEKRNFFSDLKIIIKTARVVLFPRNVY
jgi:lipopolysaccharide/colanic/teichoic acid biosynthesis glycosyltransferase